jgi:hypothetical protein
MVVLGPFCIERNFDMDIGALQDHIIMKIDNSINV